MESVTQVYACVCHAHFMLATDTRPTCQVHKLVEHVINEYFCSWKVLRSMPELWEHLGSGGVCHTGVSLCMSGTVLVSLTQQACLPGSHTGELIVIFITL